jgi:hypothetical protein
MPLTVIDPYAVERNQEAQELEELLGGHIPEDSDLLPLDLDAFRGPEEGSY